MSKFTFPKVAAAMGLATSGVLAAAFASATKEREEEQAKRLQKRVSKIMDFGEDLLRKRIEYRKKLNNHQKSIKEYARALAYLNETGNVLPVLKITDAGAFHDECIAMGVCGGADPKCSVPEDWVPKAENEVTVPNDETPAD